MNDGVFHLTVYFSGRVQGVGVRYQTLQIAKEFEVSGYVKNLIDGRVQMEAEGSEAEVVAFKEEIETQMSVFIRDVEFSSEYRSPEFAGFTIR